MTASNIKLTSILNRSKLYQLRYRYWVENKINPFWVKADDTIEDKLANELCHQAFECGADAMLKLLLDNGMIKQECI